MRRRHQLKAATCGMLLQSNFANSKARKKQGQRHQPQPAPSPPDAPTDAWPRPDPAPVAASLHAVARLGNHKVLTEMLQKEAADPWAADERGMQPLHIAAATGQKRAVAALLAFEPRLLDAATPDGRTALFLAVFHGHLGAAEELLQAGADADVGERSGRSTPLHVAAATAGGAPGCSEKLVRLLLNAGANAAQADARGGTPLHEAAAACTQQPGSTAALLCLARHRTGLLGHKAANCSTPLHILCRGLARGGSALGALQALADQGLLAAPLAGLEAADGSGFTPLAAAAAAGSLPAVQLLLSCGADPGVGPCGCHTLVGHSLLSTDEAAEEAGWGSAEALACSTRHHTCPLGVAALYRRYPIMLSLLCAGASSAGLSSLVLGRAIADGRADAASALVAAGTRCGSSARPLVAAVERGEVAVLSALLGAGLDPNCPEDPHAALRLLEAALRPGKEALLAELLPATLPAQLLPAGQAATAPEQMAAAASQQAQQAGQPGSRCRHTIDVAALADRLQLNPACFAVRRSSVAALRQLLAAGCPPGSVPAGSEQQPPPLVVAAGRLDRARCRVLLEAGAPVDERNARGESSLDVVLSLCTDAALIQLAAEETQGAAASTERQLVQLVELLAGAGATCDRFLAEHGWSAGTGAQVQPGQNGQHAACPDLGLVHGSLQLALGLPRWNLASHRRWPEAFRAAAKEALLVLQGRGVAVPPCPGRAAAERSGAARCWYIHQAGAGGRVQLPRELCLMVLSQAALPVSRWVP